jgi:PAS domain S-box-containing protein
MGRAGFMAVIKDGAGRYIYMNPTAEAAGRPADTEWYGMTDRELFPGEIAEQRAEADESVRRSGSSVFASVEQDGRTWHTERFAMPGMAGAVGILGVDITDRVRAEESVRAHELKLARLGAAIDNARDAVIVTDGNDDVVYVNPAFERMTGYAAAEVLGSQPIDAPAAQAFARALEGAKAAPDGWRGDIVDRRKDGSDLIADTSIEPIVVDGQPSPGFVTIKRDVTRERAAEREADRRVRERALIAETLGALRAGQVPEETALAVCRQLVKLPEVALASVITFGIDGTATVIGQAGRNGDGVTGVVLPGDRSSYLRQRAEAGPWVERWSGDTSHPYFAMVTEVGIMAHAYAPILVDGAVIGALIAGSDTIDAVERMAERLPALVEFSAITSTLLADAVADRMVAARQKAEVLAVIHGSGFRPVFQPIVDLASSEIRGYEALTRFADGTSPDVRFEQAHRLGLGLDLEAACLKAAFAAAEDLPLGAWLNVNVSPEVVLAGIVGGLLPTGPRAVVLEVTEHQVITDYESFRRAVDPFRDRVTIAVDDAGAGFASLRHIVELAPSMVKLDRSLVEGIGEDSSRQAVVSGMVLFAKAAGLILLAEGIETVDELDALRRLGVQLGQGYLLGMPAAIGATAISPGAGGAPVPAPPVRRDTRARGVARKPVGAAAA